VDGGVDEFSTHMIRFSRALYVRGDVKF
jgi:hypothetical protein